MNLWGELKRRNVIRIAAAYVVFGWVLLQAADILLGFTGAPEWVGKALIALLVLGFIPSLVVAWVFEVGPEGVRVDDGVQRATGPNTRRLDIVILGAVLLLMAMLVWRQMSNPMPAEVVSSPAVATDTAAPAIEPLRAADGTIAVLPFTNRSAEPDTAYFVDGIHDDLLTELSRNAALTVISRTSVMEYRDTTKNLRQIGEELGVAHVLEGAVQRAGRRVRINAQLIDAATDAHLWAETFDRELTPENIFEIQSEIATSIAQALGRALTGDGQAETQAPTSDVEAYDMYLRARASRKDWNESAIRQRLAIYQRVIERDPQFAAAMGELGLEHLNLFWFITRRDADRAEARRVLTQALALAPDDPQLQLAMAEYHYRAHLDYDAALAALDQVQARLPGSSEALELRGYTLRRRGDAAGAVAAMHAAVRLNPRSIEVTRALVETYWLIGQLDRVEDWGARLRELGDDSEWGWNMRAYAHFQRLGDPERYLASRPDVIDFSGYESAPTIVFRNPYQLRDYDRAQAELDAFGSDNVVNQFSLEPKTLLYAYIARARGDRAAADRFARQAVEALDAILRQHPDDYRAWAALAQSRAMTGNLSGTMEAMTRAEENILVRRDVMLAAEIHLARIRSLALVADSAATAAELDRYLQREMIYWGFDGLITDPIFDTHRNHPAFQALAARYSQR